MAYSSVGTPRIYVNWLEWLYNTKSFTNDSFVSWGNVDSLEYSFTQSSYIQKSFPAGDFATSGISWIYGTNTYNFHNKLNFFMLLNHNFKDKYNLRLQCYNQTSGSGGTNWISFIDDVNDGNNDIYGGNVVGDEIQDIQNKPIIFTWNPLSSLGTRSDIRVDIFTISGSNFSSTDTIDFSSAMFGRYYDFEHGSQLPSSLGISYEGIDTTTTQGGHTISNMRYSGKPSNPFSYKEDENTVSSTTYAESGRKSWTLNFKFMTNSKILPTNFNDIANIVADDYLDEYYSENENFFSTVLNKTMGSHIPFVFQPNNTDFNDMYICRFDQNDFNFEEVAPGIYDMTLKIIETW